VAPYYADVDTRNGSGRGRVWYREVTAERELLTRARDEIRAGFGNRMNFQATYLFIATWDHVGFYQRPGANISSLVSVGYIVSYLIKGGRSFSCFGPVLNLIVNPCEAVY
jgi:hypothetical protein